MPEANLPDNWRLLLQRLGQRNFEIREMIRLGFLNPDTPLHPGDSLADTLAKLSQLESAQAELDQIDQQVAASSDYARQLLSQIRAERIARSAQRRIERKAANEQTDRLRSAQWAALKSERPPHLGAGVSDRLDFSGGDEQGLAQSQLPVLHTLLDLASRLDMPTGEVQWLCYHRAVATIDHYSRFRIPKRSGGMRTISSPKPRLRIAQSFIKTEILDRLTPSAHATGFRPGMSIVNNAEPHVAAALVVRIDIKDFFPSITFPRVRGYFESIGYNPGMATVLALLCTESPRSTVEFQGQRYYVARGPRGLPQGASTSPGLANLIARGIDGRLTAWAAGRPEGWRYTRYADDLIFSTDDANADVASLLATANTVVNGEGFTINDKKTAVMRAPHRRMVTGLVVNSDIRVSRRHMRNLRAFFHQCENRGLEAVSAAIGRDAKSVAVGHLSYVHMVNADQARVLLERHPWITHRLPRVAAPAAVPGGGDEQALPVGEPVPPGVTRLELLEPDGSGKFWEIWLEGAIMWRRYGAIGTEGTTTEKQFPDGRAAAKSAEQLVKQKIDGGYRQRK